MLPAETLLLELHLIYSDEAYLQITLVLVENLIK